MIDFPDITLSTIDKCDASQTSGNSSSVCFPFLSSLQHLGLWLNCICSALGLALVGLPHYTAALFLRLRPLLIPINRQLVLAHPVGGTIIHIQLYPPYHPQKAHGFGASIYPAFIHFVSLWGGVFYFLGTALSVH